MTTTKPVALKAGMPKAERNGLYGAEDRIMEDSTEQIVVVAVMAVSKIMLEEIEDERYPIVEFVSIEPIFDPTDVETAREIMRDAVNERNKNPNQLDIEGHQASADEAAADEPGGDDEPSAGTLQNQFEVEDSVERIADGVTGVVTAVGDAELGEFSYDVELDDGTEATLKESELKAWVDPTAASSAEAEPFMAPVPDYATADEQ